MYPKTSIIYKSCICSLLSFSLVFFSIISVSGQTSNPQLDAKAQEIKNQVTKIGEGNDLTIVMKSGSEYYGSVNLVKDDSVAVNEVDQRKLVEIKYQEIKNVYKDYGNSRDRTGRRIRPKKHMLGLAIGAAAILIPVIILVGASGGND